MGLVTKTYTFSNGATIQAAEHNTNFDTLYNVINGNIENVNISASASIASSKINLSSVGQNMTVTGTHDFSGATFSSIGAINGGAINGTTIGATTPSTGAFSTLKVGTTNQGDILYDNGTSLVRLTPGTNGQVLKTQGAAANPIWTGMAGGRVFITPGANSYTPSAGITKILIKLQGAGGGGGGSTAGSSTWGGGGGGGAWKEKVVSVSDAVTYTATVGAAGTGGAQAADGTDGGASTFSGSGITTITASGGAKGIKAAGADGAGGVGATISITPSHSLSGEIGGVAGQNGASGGGGGGSYYGTGGLPAIVPDGPTVGGYGAGGGGGHRSSTPTSGSNGGDGLIIIVELN